jgi:nucleoside-diphosphate-sugar epimerase
MALDVLVTGAAGFIGSTLVRHLRRAGATVMGADLRKSAEADLRLDVRFETEVRRTFETYRPSKVVHAAAIVDERTNARLTEAVNVQGTRTVFEAARDSGCARFVQVSSIAALGLDPKPGANAASPLVEDTGSPYFDTKARSEALVRSLAANSGLDLVVIRPGDVYGPGSVPWVLRPLSMMRKRQPVLIAGGSGLIAHCHVDNLVLAIERALDATETASGPFIIHDGSDVTTYREYFTRLARAAELPAPKRSIPEPLARAVANVAEQIHRWGGSLPPFTSASVRYVSRTSTYSIEEARRDLGYVPQIDLDEGMERLAHALRAGR